MPQEAGGFVGPSQPNVAASLDHNSKHVVLPGVR